jgi:hypothetical protein
MIQKIKKHILIIASVVMLGAPSLIPSAAFAASCGNIGSSVAQGADAAVPNNGGGNIQGNCDASATAGSTQIKHIASNIVNIFSIIVGAVSIIMIIYGGFRYITSGGDSGAVGNAKNTLIYAIVGLIIVALAQVIVHFVLNQTSGVTV